MVRLTKVSLTNRTVVVLIALLTILIGGYAAGALKQELIPSIQIPRASVLAIEMGAAPEALERDVTKPLEDALKAVKGVTKVTSKSSSGVAQIRVEWDYGQDGDKIKSDIRTAVDATKSKMPSDVTTQVVAGSFDDVPVVYLAASSDEDTTALAAKLKNTVVPRLKEVAGVRDVTLSGERTHQINVTLRQADVDRLGVEVLTIQPALLAANMTIPGGTLQSGTANLDVQVGHNLATVDEIKNLRLQGTDGPVLLADIADVTEDPVDISTITRANGKSVLMIGVIKDPTGNTVAVSQGVAAAIKDLTPQLGSNTHFATIFDQAPYIEDSIKDLGQEGGLGLVMAVLVIMVFLWSIRPTIITAISIPLSLCIALIGLYVGGFTLNILTLGALTVAIGRVVDDSIVVIENIKRHQGLGEFGLPSVVNAVKEVAGAITSSTLTTVAVFLPIAFVSGQAGELFRPFAVTVTVALIASLVVSLTVVPVLASWFMRPRAGKSEAPVEDHSAPTRFQRAYLPVLDGAMAHKWITLLIAAALLGGTLALTPRLKTDFIGEAGQTTVQITQDLPAGTALATTDEAAKKIEKVIAADPSVVSFTTSVGGSAALSANPSTSDANHASFSITLKPGSDGNAAVKRYNQAFADAGDLGTLEIFVGRSNSDIQVLVESADATKLRAGADQVVTALKAINGLTNVKSDVAAAKSMLTVTVDDKTAADVGMTQQSVGIAVTRALRGIKIGSLNNGTTTMDVMLRSMAPVTTVDALKAIPLPITSKQIADTRKGAAQVVTDKQKAIQDQQKADTLASYKTQLKALADQKEATQEQLEKLTAQLAQLQALAAKGIPTVPGMPIPTQVQTLITQVTTGIAQAQAGLTTIDASVTKIEEARTKTLEASNTSSSLTQQAKDAQTAKPEALKLSEVAEVTQVEAPVSIGHVDGARAATVTALPTGSDLGTTTKQVTAALADLKLPDGVRVVLGGVSQQQADSFTQLGLAMLVAILVVYLIMVATFGSLVQPLILLVSIPFAATGALALLLISDTPLGLPSMIGLLMLIGIVVTNAIVLIDLINQYRKNGEPLKAAIRDGARLRLRPIIMTALATIMALIPMSLGITGGGVFVSKPLAIVVIGGLVSSTLLTLILVPVLYDMVEGGREKLAARRAKRKAAREAVPADADPAVADPVVDSEVDPAFDPDAVTQA